MLIISGRDNTMANMNKDDLMDQVKAQIALVNAQELITVSLYHLVMKKSEIHVC